LIRLLT
jgi:hypothetical protein